MMPAVWTAVLGLVLLLFLIPKVLRPLRRFTRARAALARAVAPRVAALRARAPTRPRR